MKKYCVSFFAAALLGLSLGFGQVQLFEQGNSGFSPFIGANASGDIQEWLAGAGYYVEGKFGLGIIYANPLSDTLYDSHPDILSKTVNPFLSMEIIEPDKQFPLSFLLNAGYMYHHGDREQAIEFTDTTGGTSSYLLTWQEHTSHIVTAGPAVGMRFYMGPAGIIAPTLGYNFNYVINERAYHRVVRDTTTTPPTVSMPKKLDKSKPMLHDIYLDIPFSYLFNNYLGIMARPKLTVRLDEETTMSIFGSFHLGVVLQLY